MNVYDFDNTIYRGESTLDFYLFCSFHHPMLFRFIFIVLFTLIKYKMCLVSEDELLKLAEKYICDFLQGCPDIEELVPKFWERNKKKIKTSFNLSKNDIIISASFGFILRYAFDFMGIVNSVCSEVDLDSRTVVRLCFRKNKVEIFKELYGNAEINDFYTDSMNDLPLMKLAKGNVYLVKGNKIKNISERLK